MLVNRSAKLNILEMTLWPRLSLLDPNSLKCFQDPQASLSCGASHNHQQPGIILENSDKTYKHCLFQRIIHEKQQNLRLYEKQQEQEKYIKDRKFLLKLPYSLKSCSKWGLQYKTLSIDAYFFQLKSLGETLIKQRECKIQNR